MTDAPKPTLTEAERAMVQDWHDTAWDHDVESATLLIESIVKAREAAARREALLEAAEEVEAIENDALVAEVAAHVPGEVGRSAVIARRDEMYEDVAGWLRALAEPEREEEGR